MRMKYTELLRAAQGFPALKQMPLAARVSVKVMRLGKVLQENVDLFNAAVKEMQEKHGVDKIAEEMELELGNMDVQQMQAFDDNLPEAFKTEADEFGESDFEFEHEVFDLPPDASVTAATLEALEGLVSVPE